MHRSRSREKKPRRAVDLLSPKPSDDEGHVRPKNWIEASRLDLDSDFKCGPPAEANSITFDFKCSSSKKESKTPRRAVLGEEMSIEKQIRRSSPSVVARLMGLDALPSPRPLKPQKEVRKSSQRFSCKEFQGKVTAHEDCVLRQHSDEYQEFKDVFEIMEEPKAENHKNQDCYHNGMPSLKQSEKDMAFIRQSFINAKRLSTDEKLQGSKEFDDALEVLDSNKDLFLKLLQEPHSLFSKHLQDLTHPPSSLHASHASKNGAWASCESSLRSEGNVERHTNLQRSDPQLLRKPAVNSYNSRPFREHMFSLPEKFSNSTHGGKLEGCAQSTEIVILKPKLDKALEVERTIRSTKSLDSTQYGVLSHRYLPKEEIMELYEEERVWKKSCETSENMKNRTESTTELAKQMRNTLATGRKISGSKHNNYVKIDSLCTKSSLTKEKNSQASQWASDNSYDYANRFSPSSSCANDASVHREARKYMSEQWRLRHHFQEIGLSIRASNTFGEMLAFSDKEAFKTAQGALAVKKACPLGIYQDGSFRNLPRSKSLPASSPVYENCQPNRVGRSKSRFMPTNIQNIKNGTFLDEELIRQTSSSLKKLRHNQNISMLHLDGEGSKLPVREIHVSAEELKLKNYAGPFSEKQHMVCKPSDFRSNDVVESFSVPPCEESAFATKDKRSKKPEEIAKSENDGKNVECEHSEILSKEASADYGGCEVLPSYRIKSDAVSPDSYKEADQPSPISVLELSYKDDKSTSGCFKNISADLQELRMQLRLLKLESADSFVDNIEAFISSDEDAGEPFSHMGGILDAFRGEDDRDYSYVLDMLIDSGILRLERRELFGECHSTELPVGLDMFEKLEKKYKSLESWSSSERKLLFDLVNSILADFAVMPFMNLCPWVKPRLSWQSKMAPEGLVEEVWQTVVRRRKECIGYLEEHLMGPAWFELGNGAEMVGRDLEIMLYNHLMDDLVDELICMQT